jgi:hypothetical protein
VALTYEPALGLLTDACIVFERLSVRMLIVGCWGSPCVGGGGVFPTDTLLICELCSLARYGALFGKPELLLG